MKKYKIFSNQFIKNSFLIIFGLIIGWFLFHKGPATEKSESIAPMTSSEADQTVWTCAMHPQIRMDKPGKCPICGMDLIPLQKSNLEIDQDAIEMSESALKLAEVQTEQVRRGIVSKKIMLNGNIEADERLLRSQTSHVSGRIEKLYINVTGESVKKDQLIATIYSPELVRSQKELLESKSLENKYPSLVEAAREKLRNLKLSEEQIKGIEKSGIVTSTFDIYANSSGIVLNRKVNEGDHVGIGTVLFDVADLTRVWGIFEAYESDLPWIKLGQKIEFTTQALPGKTFSGIVSFIDPVIDPLTRIARVRIELTNPALVLKPGMFVDGILQSSMAGSNESIIIPQSAVLWTGTRSIVYVKFPGTEYPTFKMRQITLGATMEDAYIIIDGLQEGEEIVTNGAFSVDAAAQLAGKKSMMNQEDGKVSMAHNHGNMDMGSSTDGAMNGMDGDLQSETAVTSSVDPAFAGQLTEVYHGYLSYKNALVQSDPAKANQALSAMKDALDQTDMSLLSENAHRSWMESLNKIRGAMNNLAGREDLEKLRRALAPISEALYRSIRQFGIHDKTVYYQYCPMAIGNQGAYWLSEVEDINNPYFGETMLKCGETRETITN